MSRHRAPEPPPRIDWRWHTIAALAGLGILAPPVTLWAQAVAPDASGLARTQVSTVTRAQPTTAGPLVLPTIGASGAWSPPEETTPEKPLSRPRSVPGVSVHAPTPTTTAAGLSEAAQPTVTTSDSPEPSVTPQPQPGTTERATEPTLTSASAEPTTTTPSEAPSTTTPTAEPLPLTSAPAPTTQLTDGIEGP